jgi:saccharopine dehydrogenase-like NADP-dependent oxidoreductase
VGSAAAAIAVRRKFVECLVVADYDLARATAVVDRLGDPRLVAARLDATDEAAVREALAIHAATALLNATDPRFVVPLFRAALAGGATYLDMAARCRRRIPRHRTSGPGSSSATSSSRSTTSGARPASSR